MHVVYHLQWQQWFDITIAWTPLAPSLMGLSILCPSQKMYNVLYIKKEDLSSTSFAHYIVSLCLWAISIHQLPSYHIQYAQQSFSSFILIPYITFGKAKSSTFAAHITQLLISILCSGIWYSLSYHLWNVLHNWAFCYHQQSPHGLWWMAVLLAKIKYVFSSAYLNWRWPFLVSTYLLAHITCSYISKISPAHIFKIQSL